MKWLGNVTKLMPLIFSVVDLVERVSGKKGKDKQDEAVAGIEMLIPVFMAQLPPGVFQSPEFQKLLREFIDDYVAIQNFIAKKNEGKVNP